jgi:hypothetical protein
VERGSSFRYYVTNQKVVGFIPNVTGFFPWPNPSGRHCEPLDDSDSNKKWVHGIFLRVKGGRRKVDDLTAICESNVYKM